MVLVPKETLAVLLGPTGIGILLALLVLLPVSRLLASLDLLVFLTAVALDGNANDTGIDNLPFLGPEALFVQKLVELGKQGVNDTCLGQIFPKSPNRGGVWHLAGGMKSQEA
jgi:hypothetical protein